jgi:hypothetical protein
MVIPCRNAVLCGDPKASQTQQKNNYLKIKNNHFKALKNNPLLNIKTLHFVWIFW